MRSAIVSSGSQVDDEGWMDVDDPQPEFWRRESLELPEQTSMEDITKVYIRYAREWDTPVAKAQ